jgi:hypothetical protein
MPGADPVAVGTRRYLVTWTGQPKDPLMGQLVWDASQRRDHDTAVGYFDQAINAARERGDRITGGGRQGCPEDRG